MPWYLGEYCKISRQRWTVESKDAFVASWRGLSLPAIPEFLWTDEVTSAANYPRISEFIETLTPTWVASSAQAASDAQGDDPVCHRKAEAIHRLVNLMQKYFMDHVYTQQPY